MKHNDIERIERKALIPHSRLKLKSGSRTKVYKRKKMPDPLFTTKDVIDYLGIWIIFTLFLSVLPLLIKIIAYNILQRKIELTESITEILFLSILLSTDSIRVLQLSRNKKAINSVLFFINVPCVVISMILYGFFTFSQYADYQISGIHPKPLLIALGVSALLFDLSAQIVYIVQGNLFTPISSESFDPEQEIVIMTKKVPATELKNSTAKPERKSKNP